MTDHREPTPDVERGNLPPPATPPDADDTVGTGTSIALGCIAGTLLLVVIGLLFLLIVWLIG